jgi:MFS family permease
MQPLGRPVKDTEYGPIYVEPCLSLVTVYLDLEIDGVTITDSSNLCSNVAFAVTYILLARELHLAAGVVGLLTSVGAAGRLVGALVASRIAAQLGQGPTIWLSMVVAAPTAFALPFVQRDWTLGLLAVAMVFGSAGSVIYNITQVSFRQRLCPPALLARMNATMRFLVWGTMPLGSFIGGVLGTVIGVRHTLVVAASGGCLPFLAVFLSPLGTMRNLPRYTGPAAAAIAPPAQVDTAVG